MINRFALPKLYDQQLQDDVCAWLTSNHVDFTAVPLRSEVTVKDAEIGYYVQSRRPGPGVTWAYRTAELLIPMPDTLADRWRVPPVPCDHCGKDINTIPGLP